MVSSDPGKMVNSYQVIQQSPYNILTSSIITWLQWNAWTTVLLNEKYKPDEYQSEEEYSDVNAEDGLGNPPPDLNTVR